jgi:hypothetical protein
MCAAPGSKTAQILEALHTTPPSTSPATINIPKGLVVANDSDQKRAHLLVHQSSRLPSANVCITNLDASRFPKISLGPEGQAKFGMKNLLFDRILCDVPFVLYPRASNTSQIDRRSSLFSTLATDARVTEPCERTPTSGRSGASEMATVFIREPLLLHFGPN